MRRSFWLIGILVLILAGVAGPVAYAQSGSGDKFVFDEAFVLGSGETLSGDLAVVSGSATLEAGSFVYGNIAAFGSALTIAGEVRGDVVAFGGTVRLTETAVIEGDFASFGSTVVREPGAVIRGESVGVQRTAEDSEQPGASTAPRRSLPERMIRWQIGALAWALFLTVLGVVAVLVAPRAVGRVASAAAAEPALTFGLGLLTFIVAALAGVLLLIACGLGLLIWLALGAAMLLGWIAVGLWCGQRLLAALKVRPASALGEVAVGVALITVVGRLPWCAGFLFSVIAGSIGLGAVIVTRFGTQSPDGPVTPARLDSGLEAPLGLEPPAESSAEPSPAEPPVETSAAKPEDAPEA